MRMVVVSDIDGRHLLVTGQKPVIVQGIQKSAVDSTRPQIVEATLVQGVVPVARGVRVVGDPGRRDIEVLERQGEILLALRVHEGLDVRQQLRDSLVVTGAMVIHRIVEPNPVDLERIDPIQAYIANEIARALVVEIEVLQAGESTCEGARVRAVLLIEIKHLIREIRADVVEDAVHDDVDAARVAGRDQPFEPGDLFLRPIEIIGVSILHGEVLIGLVAPVEIPVPPRRPRHEQDRVDPQLLEIIELGLHRLERRAHASILVREVIEMHLIDHQITQRLARRDGRDHVLLRAAAAHDDGRILVLWAAVAGARVADDSGLPVRKDHQVLVLIETGRQGPGRLAAPEGPFRSLVSRHREPIGEIPVRPAQPGLKIAGYPDLGYLWIEAAREEQLEPDRALVLVTVDLPGAQPLLDMK